MRGSLSRGLCPGEGSLSKGSISRRGGHCPGGSLPWGLSSGISAQVRFSLQRGLCSVGSRRVSIWGVSVQGYLSWGLPWGPLSRGGLSMGSLSRVSLSRGISVQGGVFLQRAFSPGRSVHGVSVWGFLSRRVFIGASLSRGLCPGVSVQEGLYPD